MSPSLDLDTLTLSRGGHQAGGGEFCVMEAVAFIAGEPWTDHPKCASRVIGAFMRSWNDSLDDDQRQMLKPYVLRLAGTAGTPDQEDRRAFMAADWAVRTYTPVFLRLAGLTDDADALERLPAIVDITTAKSAMDTISGARKRAAAVGDAVRDAVGAAAWDAVGAAAWDAAGAAVGDAVGAAAGAAAGDAVRDAVGDAVRDAVGAAAWDAAWDAAWAAAWAAARDVLAPAGARDVLAPAVAALQPSALALIDRMIAVTAEVTA